VTALFEVGPADVADTTDDWYTPPWLTLHRNCPKLAAPDHGAWYVRYAIPKDALDWDPARKRNQRQIGPFASKRAAADELAAVLHDYMRAGFRVAHLPSAVS
jgi:hypothetical protein